MVLYFLKSFICLLFLLSFYKLFLERESIHYFKRFFLLGSLVFATIVPFTKIKVAKQSILKTTVVTPNQKNDLSIIPPNSFTDYVQMPIRSTENFTEESLSPEVNKMHWLFIILITIYSVGLLLFLFRFVINMIKLFSKIKNSLIIKTKTHITVLLNEDTHPHSFFNYIFLNELTYQSKKIPQEVLVHEQTHVRQKHSLDILFIELLQILFWFNPLLPIIKKFIKLNHEFLADQNVLKQEYSITNYQNILLHFTRLNHKSIFISSINYSLTKKRLEMMTKRTSHLTATLWKLTSIPLVIVLVFLFSTKIEGQRDSLSNKDNETKTSLSKSIFKAETPVKAIQTKNTTIIPKEHKEKTTLIKRKEKQNAVTQHKLLAKKHLTPLANNKGINPKNVKKLKSTHELMISNKKKEVTDLSNFKIKSLSASKLMRVKIQESKATESIKIKKSARIPVSIKSKIDTTNSKRGKILINNQIIYYSVLKGKTRYYNRWGKRVDKNGEIIIGDSSIFGMIINFTIYTKKNGLIRSFGLFGLELDKRGEILEPQPVLSSSDVSPYEYIRVMNSRHAKFYLDKKLIARRKIYRILKKKKRVTVLTKIADLKNPVVNLASR